LVGHTNWARDVSFSPDGAHLASAGYDGTVRVWHAPTETVDSTTDREAAALVRSLALRFSEREMLVTAVEADNTIRDAVRAAAIEQAGEFLFYWTPMVAGHRAAERGKWEAAVEAFNRVARIAPDDATHWHWLAMAGIGAGRQETYQRACDELLRRFGPQARRIDLETTLVTWLLTPHSEDDLVRIQPLMDAYTQHLAEERFLIWLYALRTGTIPREFLDPAHPPTSRFPPVDSLVQAMAWHKAGHPDHALAAYQSGLRLVRTLNPNWAGDVGWETLRREVEALLAAGPSTPAEVPRPVTPDETSATDSGTDGQAAASVRSAGPK
jgi:hypothetical protein